MAPEQADAAPAGLFRADGHGAFSGGERPTPAGDRFCAGRARAVHGAALAERRFKWRRFRWAAGWRRLLCCSEVGAGGLGYRVKSQLYGLLFFVRRHIMIGWCNMFLYNMLVHRLLNALSSR